MVHWTVETGTWKLRSMAGSATDREVKSLATAKMASAIAPIDSMVARLRRSSGRLTPVGSRCRWSHCLGGPSPGRSRHRPTSDPDESEPLPWRQDTRRGRQKGEPSLGFPAKPGRARHHGHPDRRIERLGDPETPRHRAITATVRADLFGVPRRSGEGSDRLGLLRPRHRAALQARRALLHSPRHTDRPDRRRDREADHRPGGPAGPRRVRHPGT